MFGAVLMMKGAVWTDMLDGLVGWVWRFWLLGCYGWLCLDGDLLMRKVVDRLWWVGALFLAVVVV
jgi:hypothetical protein